MNILFYCSEYPPYKSGGIGTVTKIVAEELARLGHNVNVIGYYHDISDSFVDEKINGVRVIRYNLGYRNTRFKERIFFLLKHLNLNDFIIKRELSFIEYRIDIFIRENKIDILELTDYYPFVLCNSSLEFKKFPVPTVLRIHGSASYVENLSGRGKIAYDMNDQRHFQRCDHVLGVSEYSMSYVKNKFHLPQIKSWNVIYNPIEDSFLQKSSPVDNDNILFAGKLTETKGCFSLIKAFNICAEQHPNLQLRLAGKGDEYLLKSMIDSRFVDRVRFLGYCDREKLKEEIDNCSFACIPSYFENFSMVPLEIMGRAKTLIYTERTSGKEIVDDGVSGFLVNPDNIHEIASKIMNLLASHKLRDTMAEKAYEKVVSTFTVSRIVDLLERYYLAL